jgi:trimethylamine--corrinoid protein Co-methyltransferase
MLRKAGAKVEDGNLVFVPSRLVADSLAQAPKKIVLHDRLGNRAMSVEGDCCYYGPGSDCLNIIDHRSGQRRKPGLKDVEEGIRLCDGLSNIDFVMSLLLPADVNAALADRYQMKAMLLETAKPIVFVTYDFEGCVDCVGMAEAVAGGEDALREKPFIACYINVISGLRHNAEGLQKLLYLASKNLPALYIPSSTAGVTSPSTAAGSLALDNAGNLLGVVLSQLKREGAPVIVSGMYPGHLDMRTLVSPYAEPERGIAQALVHHYGLPMFSYGGTSDAKVVDQQAAAEAALSLLVETLAGGNIIHDLGYLESGLSYSFCQLAICNEIVDWIKALKRDFVVNDETLALDVIAKVGPDGGFLETEHTLKHFRERWYPGLFERESYDSWLSRGGKSLLERAKEKVDKVLAEHKPRVRPAEIEQRIDEIIRRAEETAAPFR